MYKILTCEQETMACPQFNCCENIEINKTNLFCCEKGKRGEEDESVQLNSSDILYHQAGAVPLLVLPATEMDYTGFLAAEDIFHSDIHTFCRDDEGDIRLLVIQGFHFIPYFSKQVFESDEKDVKGPHSPRSRKKTISQLETTQPLLGKKLSEVMPPETLNVVKSLYEQTLDGKYLQMAVIWLGEPMVPFLVRSRVGFRHDGKVDNGTLLYTPLNSKNIVQSVDPKVLRTATDHKRSFSPSEPPSQEMKVRRQPLHRKTHSGILPTFRAIPE